MGAIVRYLELLTRPILSALRSDGVGLLRDSTAEAATYGQAILHRRALGTAETACGYNCRPSQREQRAENTLRTRTVAECTAMRY